MKKTGIIDELVKRIADLEASKPANPAKEELVCPKCGGDLYYVDDGVYYCDECEEYWEDED